MSSSPTLTYFPGEIKEEYIGDLVLAFYFIGEDLTMTYETENLKKLSNYRRPAEAIRIYLGVNEKAQKEIERVSVLGKHRNAFDLDSVIVKEDVVDYERNKMKKLIMRLR